MQTKPSWITTSQSSINPSGFNKDLAWTAVQTKPSWITTSQSPIYLSGFNKDLTWTQLQSKPEWAHFIDYGGASSDFNLILKDTIVPDTTNLRNIGIPGLRWNQLNVKIIVCDDVKTQDVSSMNFFVNNFIMSIEFNILTNATLLKHDGHTFYQITAAGFFFTS